MDRPIVVCGGAQPSLADVFLAPITEYFAMTDPGRAALARRPCLSAWWAQMVQRPSVGTTRPPLG
jgi:glutathione S-transferase